MCDAMNCFGTLRDTLCVRTDLLLDCDCDGDCWRLPSLRLQYASTHCSYAAVR